MKVLVVEDSAPMRDRILRLLAEERRLSVVGVASTNAEALALFVVTLDVSLPDGVRLETLKRMVASDRPPLVIVLTEHVESHYRERYMSAGATHFVSKPDLDRLPLLLDAILSER
jgi:DNA-binding NarL/FixJ family response regulator